jgi:aryl-alcohol dehydrogenase-like predicted oxidoreductase
MTFLDVGVDTPPLGLGLAALGRPGYINLGHHTDLPSKTVDEMKVQAFAVLDAGWDAGVGHATSNPKP